MDDIKQKINEIYETDILPVLESLEPKRKKMYSEYNWFKNLIIIFGCSPVLAFFLIIFSIAISGDLAAAAFIGGFMLFLLIFLISPIVILCTCLFYTYQKKESINKFKKLLKDNLMPIILPCFEGLDLKYKDQEFQAELLEESDLFADFSRVERDDIFTGKYKNVWFHIEEIENHSGLIISEACSFDGIVIVLPINKDIKTKTVVATKNDKNINNKPAFFIWSIIIFIVVVGFIYLFNDKDNRVFIILLPWLILAIWRFSVYIENSKKYRKPKLEDIGFNSSFSVYSIDQVEARYLVTPAFMERLKNLQTTFSGSDIKCSFWSGKIMFAIQTKKDLFEFGDLSAPLTNKRKILRFVDELEAICKIIDHFKLYENTGL